MIMTDDQRALRDMAQAFARKEVMLIANQIDMEEKTPDSLIAKAAEFGLYGLYTPVEYGGSGADLALQSRPNHWRRAHQAAARRAHIKTRAKL